MRATKPLPLAEPHAMPDARDMVIEMLTDSEAALWDANRQLIDLVADLTFENARLRSICEAELLSRIHGDATIARLQRKLHFPIGDSNEEAAPRDRHHLGAAAGAPDWATPSLASGATDACRPRARQDTL